MGEVLDMKGDVIPNPTDCRDVEFDAWIKKAYLGDCLNVRNLLIQCWESLKKVKDGYVQGIANKSKDHKYMEKALKEEVYPMLYRIEKRVTRCNERLKELQDISKRFET